jgi:hypothetical protein
MCGDVELAPSALSLQLTPDDGTGTYVFVCPHCEQVQRRGANHRVVSILLATGVAYEVVDVPGPITEGEIAAFRASLDYEDWPERLGS